MLELKPRADRLTIFGKWGARLAEMAKEEALMIRTTMIGVATALLLAVSSANVSAFNACNVIKNASVCNNTRNCVWFARVTKGVNCHLRGARPPAR